MWDRAILKSNAKLALRGRYWTAFAASLVAMILTGGYSMFTWRYNFSYQQMVRDPNVNFEALMAQSGLINLLAMIGIVYSIFVAFPIVIGMARFFVQNHFGVTQFETTFSGFRQNYFNGVGAMFVTDLVHWFVDSSVHYSGNHKRTRILLGSFHPRG